MMRVYILNKSLDIRMPLTINQIDMKERKMTTLKKTSIIEWANAEVGTACDWMSQTTVEEFDVNTGDSLGLEIQEPVVVTMLAEGWS